ncbi:MAG: outer membrane protein assembly factor BamB [Mariniblastus sp.]
MFVTGRNGKSLLIKHGSELDIVDSNHLGEDVDATPEAVDKQALIRGVDHFLLRKEMNAQSRLMIA